MMAGTAVIAMLTRAINSSMAGFVTLITQPPALHQGLAGPSVTWASGGRDHLQHGNQPPGTIAGAGGEAQAGATPPLGEGIKSILVDPSAEEWAKHAPTLPRSHVDSVEAARRRKLEAVSLGPGDVPLPPAVRQLRNRASQAAQAAAKAQERAQEAVAAWVAADQRAVDAKAAYEQARHEAAQALAANTVPATPPPSALDEAMTAKLLAEMAALVAPPDGGAQDERQQALQDIHKKYMHERTLFVENEFASNARVADAGRSYYRRSTSILARKTLSLPGYSAARLVAAPCSVTCFAFRNAHQPCRPVHR